MSHIKYINTDKYTKVFFTGDIHGSCSLFMQALKDAGFNREEDLVICTGDLVDRGKENLEAIALIDEPWFETVRGNHEEFCIAGFSDDHAAQVHSASNNGGSWFYTLTYKQQEHIVDKFNTLPYILEVSAGDLKYGIVHADVPVGDWEELKDIVEQGYYIGSNKITDLLTWSRNTANKIINKVPVSSITNIDHVYLGHTVVQSPLQAGNIHLIDTGAVFTGNVTLLRVK